MIERVYILEISFLATVIISLITAKVLHQKKSSPLFILASFLGVFFMYQTSYEQNLLSINHLFTKGNSLFFIFLGGIALVVTALFSYGVGSVILVIVGLGATIGNTLKVQSRGEVTQVNDFKTGLVGDVIWNMVLNNFWSYLFLGIIALFIATLFFLFWKYDQYVLKLRYRIVMLLMGSLLSIGMYMNAEKVVEYLGLSIIHLNPEDNLSKFGPGGYFLISNQQEVMEKPEKYNEDEMKKIVKNLKDTYPKKNSTKKELPTIINVLSEAFVDPTQFKDTEWNADPMPTVRSYMEKNGGKMLSSVFGGGTSNTEFSILSGLSYDVLKPNSYVYNYLTSNKRDLPILTPYKKLGYTPVAIHTHLKSGYNRDELFSELGFEKYIAREDLLDSAYYSEGYISDYTFFDTIKGQLETHQEPLFIHGISMQNHFPYTEDYKGKLEEKDNLLKNPEAIPSGKQLSLYARGIKETDNQVKAFTDHLKTINKPVYLLFYGDHFPALNNELYENQGVTGGFSKQTAKYETPYFIWTNQDFTADEKSELLNPEFLNELVLEQAGIPQTIFQAFLGDLRKTVPAFRKDSNFYLNSNGEKQKLNSEQKEFLATYQLIEYDMLIGKQYSKELFD